MRFWDSGNSGGGSTPPPNNPIIKIVGLDAAGNQYPLTLGPGLAITGNVLDVTGSGGGGNTNYSAEAQAYFARLTGTYSNTWKTAVNTLIASLMSAGIWDDRLGIYLGTVANNTDGLLNLKGTNNPLVLTGAATASLTGGWQGGGGIFDNSYTVGSGIFTQDDCGMDIWVADAPVSTDEATWYQQIACGFFILNQAGYGASRIVPRAPTTFFGSPFAGKSFGAVQSSGVGVSDFTSNDYAPGFLQFNRVSATGFHSAFGATEQSATTASVNTITGTFKICNFGWQGRWLACSIGAGLTTSQQTSYRTALTNFFAAIGAS